MELAIAVVVLAVGILGVFASFAYGLKATRQGGRTGEAVGRARQIVELIRSRNLPFTGDLPPARASGLNDQVDLEWSQLPELAAPPFSTDLPADTGFRRSIQVRRLLTDKNSYRYGIAEITVTVYWVESGKQRQVSLKALHRQP